jgi:hypothetical protein
VRIKKRERERKRARKTKKKSSGRVLLIHFLEVVLVFKSSKKIEWTTRKREDSDDENPHIPKSDTGTSFQQFISPRKKKERVPVGER